MKFLKTCSRLRTGTAIIGTYSLIIGTIAISICIAMMAKPQLLNDWYETLFHQSTKLHPEDPSLTTIKSLVLSWCLVFITTSIILLVGAIKGLRFLLLPWLVQSALSFLAYVLLFMIFHAGLYLCILLVAFALKVFKMVVVSYHFRELREKSNEINEAVVLMTKTGN